MPYFQLRAFDCRIVLSTEFPKIIRTQEDFVCSELRGVLVLQNRKPFAALVVSWLYRIICLCMVGYHLSGLFRLSRFLICLPNHVCLSSTFKLKSHVSSEQKVIWNTWSLCSQRGEGATIAGSPLQWQGQSPSNNCKLLAMVTAIKLMVLVYLERPRSE